MPRMMRFEHPGSLVHIMARGIDGQSIFIDDEDRIEFLQRFALCLHGVGYKCLCWCLMANHYHLFLRTSDQPMSMLMRPLNGGYARWINHKYKRRGYLFQDRFKSLLCQDTEYAKQLIRYVHLNPLRAGVVTSLEGLSHWPWCGHAYLLAVRGAHGQGFQDRNEALRRFGGMIEEAKDAYLEFMYEGINPQSMETSGYLPESEAFEIAGSEKGWPAVIGDQEFAYAAFEANAVAIWRKHRQIDYKAVLKKIAAESCERYKIDYESLFQKGRVNARSQARENFCYRAHYEEKIPFAAIARFLRTTITPATCLAQRERENRRLT